MGVGTQNSVQRINKARTASLLESSSSTEIFLRGNRNQEEKPKNTRERSTSAKYSHVQLTHVSRGSPGTVTEAHYVMSPSGRVTS